VAERIKLMKNPLITSKMEDANLRFAAQGLNRLRHRIPHSTNGVAWHTVLPEEVIFVEICRHRIFSIYTYLILYTWLV